MFYYKFINLYINSLVERGKYMKKLISVVMAALFLAVLLTACGSKEKGTAIGSLLADNNEIYGSGSIPEESTVYINDLLYRKYEQGVSLEENSALVIENPVIGKEEEEQVSIYVMNHKNGEVTKLMDYEGGTIQFRADFAGVYSLFAVAEDGKGESHIEDITAQAGTEIEYQTSESGMRELR